MAITVTPLSDALGAEIEGVDLSRVLDDATQKAVRDAWNAHLVLLFRHQDFSPEDQLRFARCLGPVASRKLPDNYNIPASSRETPGIAYVSNIRLADGSPVSGASLTTLFGGPAVSGADGFFSLAVNVPSGSGLTVSGTANVMSEDFIGASGVVDVVTGGFSDAGIIVLRPRFDDPIFAEAFNFSAKRTKCCSAQGRMAWRRFEGAVGALSDRSGMGAHRRGRAVAAQQAWIALLRG